MAQIKKQGLNNAEMQRLKNLIENCNTEQLLMVTKLTAKNFHKEVQ